MIITNTRELHRIVFNSKESYERQFKPEYISSFRTKEYNMLSFVQILIKINRIYFNNKSISTISLEYDEIIIYVLKYINENLIKNITLDLLESKFHITKYYLCHLFEKNTGFTVVEYIIYKRIMRAEELLISGTPIINIPNQVGFGDYSNFYRSFKKVLGISPKKYMSR